MARHIGDSPTQEVRDKQMKSIKNKRPVITPLGYFCSFKEAARAHNCERTEIKNRTEMGQRQRDGISEVKGRYKLPDRRGYIALTPTLKPNGQPVRTPIGDFPTVKAAADAHGITSAGVIHKLNDNGQTLWIRL